MLEFVELQTLFYSKHRMPTAANAGICWIADTFLLKVSKYRMPTAANAGICWIADTFLLKVQNAHCRQCWNLLNCGHFFTQRTNAYRRQCVPLPMQEFVDLQTLFYTFVLFHPNFIDTCHELRPLTKTFSNVRMFIASNKVQCTTRQSIQLDTIWKHFINTFTTVAAIIFLKTQMLLAEVT